MPTKRIIAHLALLVPVAVGGLSMPFAAVALPTGAPTSLANSSETRAAAKDSQVLIAPPRPGFLPRRGCASVKFPWAVVTDETDYRIYIGVTLYRFGSQVDEMTIEGIYPNRFYDLSSYVCRPGTYTVRVDGEIRELSTGNWKTLARLAGARKFVIRRR